MIVDAIDSGGYAFVRPWYPSIPLDGAMAILVTTHRYHCKQDFNDYRLITFAVTENGYEDVNIYTHWF
jgi:hypothetical protein